MSGLFKLPLWGESASTRPRYIPLHIQYLEYEVIQNDFDFVYNIITAGGINLLSFLYRAKQARSQGLLIIYVTQIPPKLHLCGLFAFHCQKRLSASRVMVSSVQSVFFF